MNRKIRWFSGSFVAVLLFFLLLLVTPPLTSAQGPGDLVINEFLADPPNDNSGDANQDGVRDADDDEFVEIVNSSGSTVDISGWTINVNLNVKHIFPPNTVLKDGCGIVIFGGGTPTDNFGDCIVQVASSDSLGLSNTGAIITLYNGEVVIDSYTYSSGADQDQSLTRVPDVTGLSFYLHSEAPGSDGAIFSPGTRVDESMFGSGCLEDEIWIFLPLVMK